MGENALLTVRGFSSHLQWDWVKSEGVWRRRFFTGTGSRLTRGSTEAFWTISVFAGSLFSFRFKGWGAHEGLTEVVCIGILFWTFFNLRVADQSTKHQRKQPCYWEVQILIWFKYKFVSENKLRRECVHVCNLTKQNKQKLEHEPVTHLWKSLWILFWLCWRRTGGESILTGRREESLMRKKQKQTKRKVWVFIFKGSAANYEMAANITWALRRHNETKTSQQWELNRRGFAKDSNGHRTV